jgi:hypothetical protein
VRNPLWRNAQAVPSLDLDFANNKSLTDRVTSQNLVSFTRASSGTYVGSDGLIKTAVTNLLLRSEEFDNASWAKDFTIATANQTTAPNGTLTADKVAEDTSTNFHAVSQYVAGFASGAVLTLSIYAKAAGRSLFRIQTDASGGTGTADFNLSAVTATSGTGVFTAGSIQAVGDGWYRCSVRCTTSTAGAVGLKVILGTTTVGSYTGDGTSGLFLWGAQLEQSSTVGEYVPTAATINSAPRFDHSVTSSTTNLLLRSEEFETASWTKVSSTISANAAAAPNGTTTADKLIVDNGQSAGYAAQSSSFTSGTTWTVSCFAKASEVSDFRFVFESTAFGSNLNAVFNLSTGVVTSFTAGSASIQALPNGWYRCIATATTTATASASIQFRSVHAGNGTNGIFVWGAQLEQSSTVGPYVPTTTAAATNTNTESLGLLVEEARTNLWQWSNSATNNETWTNVSTGGLTLTVGQTSPTGDSTAIRAADVDSVTAATTLERTTVAPALTAGTAVTYSIFIKPLAMPNSTIAIAVFANGTTDQIRATFGAGPGTITAPANTTTGTGSVTNASFVAYPNGWFRLILSGIPSTVTMADCRVRIILGTYARSTGTARFDWYGAQFENAAFVTSYFPNTGTLGGVTRAADVASITGSNFSSWYNQTEGTVFSSFKRISYTGTSTVVSINDNTTNNRLYNLRQDTAAALTVISATAGSVDASPSLTLSSGASVDQVAVAQQLNDFGASANGGTVATDSTVLMPTVTQANIGNITSSSFFNGTIKRLVYWGQRLPNNVLQAITQ